ncbi:hypothetical protein ACS0TY_013837 [Phlomoides rotata]
MSPIRITSVLESSKLIFFPAMSKIVGTLGPNSRLVEVFSGCLRPGMSEKYRWGLLNKSYNKEAKQGPAHIGIHFIQWDNGGVRSEKAKASYKWLPNIAYQIVVALDEDNSPSLRLWDMRNIMSPVKEFVGHQRMLLYLFVESFLPCIEILDSWFSKEHLMIHFMRC